MDKFWEIQDIIYEIQKNKHEKIVVSKCYRKGKYYLDVRIHLEKGGTYNPTSKGFTLELEKAITATGNQPVILCSSPIRLLFRNLVERTYPQISIMSYNEISPNVKVKSVGMVKA